MTINTTIQKEASSQEPAIFTGKFDS